MLADFDGNERASLHLRDNDLNLLHILLQQLQQNKLSEPATRRDRQLLRPWSGAVAMAIDSQRTKRRVGALRQRIEEQRKAQPKSLRPRRRNWATIRKSASLRNWKSGPARRRYRICSHLDEFAGTERTVSSPKLKIEDLIAKNAMGERNSVYELQNYIVGGVPGGLQLRADGSLDLEKSFVRVDYFALLQSVVVKNNVQPEHNRPSIWWPLNSAIQLQQLVNEENLTADVIWVNGGSDKQALIMARADSQGNLSFRYLPIKGLTQDAG